MALSGSVRGSVVDEHYSAWVDWSASQDIGGNTSTITATLYFSCDWDIDIGERTHTIWIDGEAFDISDTPTSGTGTWNLGSVSKTIGHNSDGTKAFSISFSYDMGAWIRGDYYESITGSDSWTLDTIARASNPSLSASSVIMGNSITVYTNRQSTLFTHTIKYEWGNSGQVKIGTGIADSFKWTVPLNFANSIPNSTSGTCTFYVSTWSNGSVIGTKAVSFTVTVPTNIGPSLSSIACSDPNGYASTYGAYVQNKSKVKVTVTASGSYSSTIKSYKITANGMDYTYNGLTTDVITTSGSNTIKVVVTDSRGRTATKTTTINVLAYSSPVISELSVYRCTSNGTANDEGAYMRVTFKASITALNNKNGKKFVLQYRKQNLASYTTHTTYTGAYTWNSSVIIAADINSAYDIQLVVTDNFGTTAMVIQVSTAFTLMDFRNTGRGVALGKVSEQDAFECKLKAIFSGIVEGIYPVGSIYMTTVNKNPSAYFGGTWVAWGSGRVPVGVNISDTNFNTVEKTGGSAAIQAHTHSIPSLSGSTNSAGSHSHSLLARIQQVADNWGCVQADGSYSNSSTGESYGDTQSGGLHSHTVTTKASTSGSTGSGNSGNLQPYITCYMWKRTA